jgi:hypothetical protein
LHVAGREEERRAIQAGVAIHPLRRGQAGVEVKNIAESGGKSDRGTGSVVKHFLKGEDDLAKSEEHLREIIVDYDGFGPEQKASLVDTLQTVSQKEKIASRSSGSGSRSSRRWPGS